MASEALPPEMIFEILSRTSLETMERCEAASKCLKQMIHEPSFLFLHCKRSNCVFGYFFQTVINYRYQSALVSDDEGGAAANINRTWPRGGPHAGINRIWQRDDMKILATCDQGILCCERQRCHKKVRYYACKPATNQWQRLPNPKLRYQTASAAVVVIKSHPMHYKIVRLSEPRSGINYICEIFDSENRAWEKTEAAIHPYVYFIKNPDDHPVSVGQSIHWLITCSDNHWLTSNDNLLTFDVSKSKRCFRCFPLPECNDAYICKKLVKYEGGLGLTCLTADWKTTELWVAERLEWRRKMVVDMKFLEETLRSPQLVEFCNTDVVFITTDDGAVFYNLRDRSFRKVKVPYHKLRHSSMPIFRFRSDLEMADLDQTPG